MAGLLGVASNAVAVLPVEDVKVCPIYGAGFHYIPGTDICISDFNGDARQQTEGGTWRSLLPYPQGTWSTDSKKECDKAKLVKLGTFKTTDFTLNVWQRKQTSPISLKLKNGEFVTKVIMDGGFYDPRIPARHGASSSTGNDGLCVRSIDPNLVEMGPGGPFNNPWGNGMLPIGCISNAKIVNMPAAYSIAATSAHPSIDANFYLPDQLSINGPITYGTHLVVTTDLGPGGESLLTYTDVSSGTAVIKPLAGDLSVAVCVDRGD